MQTTSASALIGNNLSISRNLHNLIHDLKSSPPLSPKDAQAIVQAANISESDLMQWATFDHPVADSYGRALVFDGGSFEVMVMSWCPGDCSAIHDHGAAQWGAVQCFGPAEHYIYQLQGRHLSELEIAHYTPGMVHPVSHHLIHQMGNSSEVPFLSLHVYGCPHPMFSITGNARIFDLYDSSIQYTDGGVFFCLPSDQIKRQCVGLTADPTPRLRHHQQMRDRIQRRLQGQPDLQLERKLRSLDAQIYHLQSEIAPAAV